MKTELRWYQDTNWEQLRLQKREATYENGAVYATNWEDIPTEYPVKAGMIDEPFEVGDKWDDPAANPTKEQKEAAFEWLRNLATKIMPEALLIGQRIFNAAVMMYEINRLNGENEDLRRCLKNIQDGIPDLP